MTNAEYMKHAYLVYQNAVASEGSRKKSLLKQALDILENVPDGYPADEDGAYPGKDDLVSRIEGKLQKIWVLC